MTDLQREISRRRTFAIISHPDAGKTTLTEKFLLYGGAIQTAGSVKGKATAKHAVSDWMDLEKQRGISITSSVMQFEYEGYCLNILDTPGHQDFSEDTYRTLMAADSAVMVIDAAKGIEAQTRKLFKVCAMRHIPIFTFINKLDREARDPFELLDELEKEFGIGTYPVNWPIGCGVSFKGVFDRDKREILTFNEFHKGQEKLTAVKCDITDTEKLDELLGEYQRAELVDQIELLDGASFEFDIEKVRRGELSPVFFGSALTNFGVEPFLENFLKMTTPPLPRLSDGELIDPFDENFSAFAFKIQANMNKQHRDRITFFRICSGKFERGADYYHVQAGKTVRLSQPQQMMASAAAAAIIGSPLVARSGTNSPTGAPDPAQDEHTPPPARQSPSARSNAGSDIRSGEVKRSSNVFIPASPPRDRTPTGSFMPEHPSRSRNASRSSSGQLRGSASSNTISCR